MTRLPLISACALLLAGCFDDEPAQQPDAGVFFPGPGGGGGGGGKTAKISGKLTLFQGAQSVSASGTAMSDEHVNAAKRLLSSMAGTKKGQAESSQPRALPLPDTRAPSEPWSFEAPAGRRVVEGEVIVRVAEKLSAADVARIAAVEGYGTEHIAYVTEYLHLLRFTRKGGLRVDAELTDKLASTLAERSRVLFAEANVYQYAMAVPNDTYYGYQWHYPAMNLPAAWDVTQGSNATIVAVVDTGIVPHAELDVKVLPGFDFITEPTMAADGDGRDNSPLDMGGDMPQGGSSWHGTHVAGTIAASSNNGAGVAGVDWNARILPVRVLGRGGGTLADIASGMAWSFGATVPGAPTNPNKAAVINLSLGGGGQDPSPTYQDVISAGVAAGAIFVIAAGNSNEDAAKTIPCNQDSVICVGATRHSGTRSSFSNFGAVVDMMAPGGELADDLNGDGYPDGILSTFRNAQNQAIVEFQQGTSMACPHVAGLVSLMKGVSPSMTHVQAEQILKTSANSAFQCSEGCGAGLVNAHAAVLAAGGSAPTGPAKLTLGTAELYLTTAQPSGTIIANNTGGQALSVSVAASGAAGSSLSFPAGTTVSIPAGSAAAIQVTANTSGLSAGNHAAVVSLSSSGGSAQVAVTVKAGAATVDKDAVLALAYFDENTMQWTAQNGGTVSAASNYAYTFDATPGAYWVVAGVDEDGDGEFFEEGERSGIYPTMDSPTEVTLTSGAQVSNVDFALIPFKSVGSMPPPTKSGVGGACTTNDDCQSADCVTTWPGGYCTQGCTNVTCPTGSTCFDLGNNVLACLADCSGPDTGQSNCRSSYVCSASNTGAGYCWPACTSDADCGGFTCDVGSGYCF